MGKCYLNKKINFEKSQGSASDHQETYPEVDTNSLKENRAGKKPPIYEMRRLWFK